MQMLRELTGDLDDRADVRFLVAGQRGRHANQDHVALPQRAELLGRRKPARTNDLLELGDVHVRDVILPSIDPLNLFRRFIDPDHAVPGLGLEHSQGKADISQAHDTDCRGPFRDLF